MNSELINFDFWNFKATLKGGILCNLASEHSKKYNFKTRQMKDSSFVQRDKDYLRIFFNFLLAGSILLVDLVFSSFLVSNSVPSIYYMLNKYIKMNITSSFDSFDCCYLQVFENKVILNTYFFIPFISFTWFYKSLSLDQNQALRLCLGSTSVGGQYGAISALSINNDCSRLLCGFAKGQVNVTLFIHRC